MFKIGEEIYCLNNKGLEYFLVEGRKYTIKNIKKFLGGRIFGIQLKEITVIGKKGEIFINLNRFDSLY